MGLTDMGKSMSAFPLEPQYARTLLAAQEFGCIPDAVTLVSLLSSEGVWFRPSRKMAEQAEIAEQAQRRFFDKLGDHTTLLNVYQQWEDSGCNMEWCKKNYLHFRALRQARDIRSQLAEQLEKAGCSVRGSRGSKNYSKVLQSLCQGFFMQSARACAAGGGYLIVQENVLVTPEGGSVLAKTGAEWLLYSELVGATIAHCMMRTVSVVDKAWLEPLLPRLAEVDLKRLVGMASNTKKKEEVPEKDPALLAKEKEEKMSSARERFLARKAGAAGSKR